MKFYLSKYVGKIKKWGEKEKILGFYRGDVMDLVR